MHYLGVEPSADATVKIHFSQKLPGVVKISFHEWPQINIYKLKCD